MAISRNTQQHLAKGDFETLEGEWLAAMGQNPGDLDYFVGVARALTGAGQEDRARLLLEMLDEQLRESGRWDIRRKLLQRVGTVLFTPEKLHPAILSTLKQLYGDRSIYQGLVEAVGLQRAPQDIPKTWEKVEKLESLLAFDVGTVVAMEGKGVGRIAEANLGLESFKVDFEQITRHDGRLQGRRQAAAAAQARSTCCGASWRSRRASPPCRRRSCCTSSCELRPAAHRRRGQATSSPASSPSRSGPPGGARRASTRRWWPPAPAAARPTAGPRAAADALDSLWKAFEKADPRKKIERLKRDGARDPGMRERMAEDLAARRQGDGRPGPRARLRDLVRPRPHRRRAVRRRLDPRDAAHRVRAQPGLRRHRGAPAPRARLRHGARAARGLAPGLPRRHDQGDRPARPGPPGGGRRQGRAARAGAPPRHPLRPAAPQPRRLHLAGRARRERRGDPDPQPPAPAAADPLHPGAGRVLQLPPAPAGARRVRRHGAPAPAATCPRTRPPRPRTRCCAPRAWSPSSASSSPTPSSSASPRAAGRPAPAIYALRESIEVKSAELHQIMTVDIPAQPQGDRGGAGASATCARTSSTSRRASATST